MTGLESLAMFNHHHKSFFFFLNIIIKLKLEKIIIRKAKASTEYLLGLWKQRSRIIREFSKMMHKTQLVMNQIFL